MTDTYCMILTTTDSQDESKRLAEFLLKEHLAACVQVFPINSTYHWDGELVSEPEWILFIKTRSDLFDRVERLVLAHHSYETPEIIQLPVMRGSADYLAWVSNNT